MEDYNATRSTLLHPARWWGIRHLRYVYHFWHVHSTALEWARYGVGCGIPHEHDLAVLDAIRRGEA